MALQIAFDTQASPSSTQTITRSFEVAFDGDSTVYASTVGTATSVVIEGGPRGRTGPPGDQNVLLLDFGQAVPADTAPGVIIYMKQN